MVCRNFFTEILLIFTCFHEILSFFILNSIVIYKKNINFVAEICGFPHINISKYDF